MESYEYRDGVPECGNDCSIIQEVLNRTDTEEAIIQKLVPEQTMFKECDLLDMIMTSKTQYVIYTCRIYLLKFIKLWK